MCFYCFVIVIKLLVKHKLTFQSIRITQINNQACQESTFNLNIIDKMYQHSQKLCFEWVLFISTYPHLSLFYPNLSARVCVYFSFFPSLLFHYSLFLSLPQIFFLKPLTVTDVPDQELGEQSGKPIALIEVKNPWALREEKTLGTLREWMCVRPLHTRQGSSVTCQHPDGLIFPACASIKRLWGFCMASCTPHKGLFLPGPLG